MRISLVCLLGLKQSLGRYDVNMLSFHLFHPPVSLFRVSEQIRATNFVVKMSPCSTCMTVDADAVKCVVNCEAYCVPNGTWVMGAAYFIRQLSFATSDR
jgi:hypothetical protein